MAKTTTGQLLIFCKFDDQKTAVKKIFGLSFFLFFIFSSFSFSSCCGKKESTTTAPEVTETKSSQASQRDFEKEGYVKATVVDSEVDACKYLLQLEPVPNGPEVLIRLEPTNLQEEFKKYQLAVWIKYAPKKGAVSSCMAGTIVELSDIQIRK